MKAWQQRGFVVVSRTSAALPLFHGFYRPQWVAERARDKAIANLPQDLREAIMVVPAVLHYELPD